jgi:endonuclease/exonuclease/phosphatase family metal-dependent hydrolase
MNIKIATWNVQLPVARRRREKLRQHADREQADIWVLTETHDGFTPGDEYKAVSSAAGRDGTHKAEHRWVSIWSKHPLEPLKTSDSERTAAARVSPASGDPYIVFGTVLPWIGSKWHGHPSAGGVAFGEALALQSADWVHLRKQFPKDEFFLIGDFNQDLVSRPPRYYGSVTNRKALEAALDRAGLMSLTGGDNDPIRRDSPPCACIDHICTRRDSKWLAGSTVRWPDSPVPQRGLSDHFGVSVSLSRR